MALCDSEYHSTTEGYRYAVRNVGVGPALGRSMRIQVDGRFAQRWRDVGAAVSGDTVHAFLEGDFTSDVTSTFGRGSVLLPGDAVTMVCVRGRRVPQAFTRALADDAHFVTTACYCSV